MIYKRWRIEYRAGHWYAYKLGGVRMNTNTKEGIKNMIDNREVW